MRVIKEGDGDALFFAVIQWPDNPKRRDLGTTLRRYVTEPYVPPVVGPYHPDETDAIERGQRFLRQTYGTEDVRKVEGKWTPDEARGAVLAVAMREWQDREAWQSTG